MLKRIERRGNDGKTHQAFSLVTCDKPDPATPPAPGNQPGPNRRPPNRIMVSWSPVVPATIFVLAHLHLTEHGVREGLHQLLHFWSDLGGKQRLLPEIEN